MTNELDKWTKIAEVTRLDADDKLRELCNIVLRLIPRLRAAEISGPEIIRKFMRDERRKYRAREKRRGR